MPADIPARFRVTHEWARLRTVLVGRPFYRVARPYPESLKASVAEATWTLIKAEEGRLLEEAFPPVFERARGQMDHVVTLLASRGVSVLSVPAFLPHEEYATADGGAGAIQFFPRDPLLVADDRVFELALCDTRRRPELLPLRRLLGCVVGPGDTMPDALRHDDAPEPRAGDGARLEGGDCLVAGCDIFVGQSGRGSNAEGIAWLQARLGPQWRVSAIPLQPQVPHLDMALSLLRPGLGIRWRGAFPEGLPAAFADWEWIEVDAEDALRRLAVNALPLHADAALVVAEVPALAEALSRHGVEPLPVPFKGVAWLGGGLRCWTQALWRED